MPIKDTSFTPVEDRPLTPVEDRPPASVKDSQLFVSDLPETEALLAIIKAKISTKRIVPLSAIEMRRMDNGTKELMRDYRFSAEEANAISLFSAMVDLHATEFVNKCKPIVARCDFKEGFESTALEGFSSLSTPLGYFALLEMEYRYANVMGITPGDFQRGSWWLVKRFFGELWHLVRNDDQIRKAIKQCQEGLRLIFRRLLEIIWDMLRGRPSSGPASAT